MWLMEGMYCTYGSMLCLMAQTMDVIAIMWSVTGVCLALMIDHGWSVFSSCQGHLRNYMSWSA